MKIVVNPKYEALREFVEQLHDNFESSGEMVHDGRNTLKMFSAPDGSKVVVKRYKRPNLFNRFAYTFVRGTKAMRAYKYAHKLDKMAIPTPTAIAYVDVRRRGLVDTSYLVTDYSDTKGLVEAREESPELQRRVLEAFVEFVISIHNKGVRHLDLTYTNARYSEDENGVIHFCLIDINRMKFQKMTRRRSLLNLRRVFQTPKYRDILSTEYARQRGWDIEDAVAEFEVYHTKYHTLREGRRGLKRKLLPWRYKNR